MLGNVYIPLTDFGNLGNSEEELGVVLGELRWLWLLCLARNSLPVPGPEAGALPDSTGKGSADGRTTAQATGLKVMCKETPPNLLNVTRPLLLGKSFPSLQGPQCGMRKDDLCLRCYRGKDIFCEP